MTTLTELKTDKNRPPNVIANFVIVAVFAIPLAWPLGFAWRLFRMGAGW
jgi:hypothetical protein